MINRKEESLVTSLEAAFVNWNMTEEGEFEIEQRSSYPEVQELKDYLSGLEAWEQANDEWLELIQLCIMPEWAFRFLLPAILRYSVSNPCVDYVYISTLVGRFSKLPKVGQCLVLLVEPPWFSKAQIKSVCSVLTYLFSDFEEQSGRLPKHFGDIIENFKQS